MEFDGSITPSQRTALHQQGRTGFKHDRAAIPALYAHVRRLEKPVEVNTVLREREMPATNSVDLARKRRPSIAASVNATDPTVVRPSAHVSAKPKHG